MGLHSFDRATSKLVDSSGKQNPQDWGNPVEEANKVKANADTFEFGALNFTGNTVGAANEGRFALAA